MSNLGRRSPTTALGSAPNRRIFAVNTAPPVNRYVDEGLIRARLAQEGHRRVVGGLWEVMGPLQRDFLIAHGMTRSDRVLDVGCGALRAGAPIAAWLDAGGYYGIDISPGLIEAGYREEALPAGLADKLPRDHLHVTDDFEVPFGVAFDLGLATSLFTHLPLDAFTHCLERVAHAFRPGARLFATVFEGAGADIQRPGGVVTHDDRDPFHFPLDRIAAATPEGWAFHWIGDWGHPRGQEMVRLTRV
jgi:SAM-dependent methyltransferase